MIQAQFGNLILPIGGIDGEHGAEFTGRDQLVAPL